MRLLNVLFIITALSSCSGDYLIKYSIVSDGEFKVLYSDNIEACGVEYWHENRYEQEVFIYVTGNKELDVRVMYIGRRGLTLYNRTVGEGPILIQGKIYDL